MSIENLEEIAQAMVATGKGIIAVDGRMISMISLGYLMPEDLEAEAA